MGVATELVHLNADFGISSTWYRRRDTKSTVNYSFDLFVTVLAFLFCSYVSCSIFLSAFPVGDLGI